MKGYLRTMSATSLGIGIVASAILGNVIWFFLVLVLSFVVYSDEKGAD